ncbi:hypothetical protein BDV41DRAFT_238662 [Aspergillus transmontanensis]|uniref:Uncharacterized protein n=1 Tax=Aspergillus transmontanensis TaxID=1034304 RepID=A0A5N6WI72_9EURO|nr:hypothetical protein BDV41DRAFT_238662 [Aspergillus transmontanensis]
MMNSKSRLSPSPIDTPTPSLHSHYGRILHVCDVSADWYGYVMMGVDDMRFKESSDRSWNALILFFLFPLQIYMLV